MSENKRAARAARSYEQLRAILCKTNNWFEKSRRKGKKIQEIRKEEYERYAEI